MSESRRAIKIFLQFAFDFFQVVSGLDQFDHVEKRKRGHIVGGVRPSGKRVPKAADFPLQRFAYVVEAVLPTGILRLQILNNHLLFKGPTFEHARTVSPGFYGNRAADGEVVRAYGAKLAFRSVQWIVD